MSTIRQFACDACKSVWWKKVPDSEPVFECKHCNNEYYAVPQDQEWGLAVFECDCGHSFKGRGAMGKAKSECYECRAMCAPDRILPPFRRRKWRHGKHPHSCTGENCYSSRGHHHRGDKCVHPKSNPSKVLVASKLYRN